MAESSRRFKSTATIPTKLLQAKGQGPGGARRLGTELQTRPLAANGVATHRRYHSGIVLVDPRDSHVYQPSLGKKLAAYKYQVMAA